MRELRLRSSLFILLVTAVMLTFSVVGAGVLLYRLPQVEEHALQQLQVQTDGAARLLDQFTIDVEALVSPLAKLALNGPGSDLQPYLDAIPGNGEIFEAVFILDASGGVEALGLPPRLRQAATELRGADFSGNILYRAARASAGSRNSLPTTWSDKYLSALSGKNTVGVALPADDKTVIGETSLDRILLMLRSVGTGSDSIVTIIDGQGRWLASSNPEVDPGRFTDFGSLPAFRAILSGKQPPESEIIRGNRVLIRGGISEKLGWIIISTTPAGWQNYDYRVTVLTVVGSSVLALLVCLALAPFWAARMARPLHALTRRTREVTNGDYLSPWPARGAITELNELARDLGKMAAGILARQTELARSEERLRATLENTPSIAMQWYDLGGRIVYWNRASEIMYGCSSEQALGVCIAENPLMFADQEHATGFIKVLAEIDRTGQPFGPAEFKLRGKEGEMLTVLATSFAIPAEDGGKIFVCMGVDITAQRTVEDEIRALNSELERRVGARTGELVQANRELASTVESLKSTQEQLVQADKLAALGSMVAGIAHELNTPIGNSVLLTSTLGDKTADFARLVEADKLRRADLKQYLETAREALILMDRNLASAVNLIRSFKQVSADRASSQRRRFDLAPVCHDVVATLMPAIRRAGHRIEVEVNDGIEMESYPGPLGQIITNFVNNAMLHAFGQGQHGLMRLQCSHIGTDGVEIRFSDNGCGIPLADHRRIFDPFFTTKLGTGGSGLGLNIVYNIVTGLLGGTISFDSEVDEGTTFIIVLPLVTSAH